MNEVNMKVVIRRNSDGMILSEVWNNWSYNEFWWSDGSASCDCNREIFFDRMLGIDSFGKTQCGDGKFSVKLFDVDTGEILYSEF